MDKDVREFSELVGVDIHQYVVDHSQCLTFPEKLMYLMIFVERETTKAGKRHCTAPILWTPDGCTVIIMNEMELENVWLPRFFLEKCKFSSFTRKLYRWGFKRIPKSDVHHQLQKNDVDCNGESSIVHDQLQSRQVAARGVHCFRHHNFQRDHKNLLYHMESTTPSKLERKKAEEYTRALRKTEQEAVSAQIVLNLRNQSNLSNSMRHQMVPALMPLRDYTSASFPPQGHSNPGRGSASQVPTQFQASALPELGMHGLESVNSHNKFLAYQYLLAMSLSGVSTPLEFNATTEGRRDANTQLPAMSTTISNTAQPGDPTSSVTEDHHVNAARMPKDVSRFNEPTNSSHRTGEKKSPLTNFQMKTEDDTKKPPPSN